MRAPLGNVTLLGTHNGKPVEERPRIIYEPLNRRLEVALQRAQHQRLAEPARTAEQGDAATVDKVTDNEGLVHVDVACHHIREALYADGDAADTQPVDHARSPLGPHGPVAHGPPPSG